MVCTHLPEWLIYRQRSLITTASTVCKCNIFLVIFSRPRCHGFYISIEIICCCCVLSSPVSSRYPTYRPVIPQNKKEEKNSEAGATPITKKTLRRRLLHSLQRFDYLIFEVRYHIINQQWHTGNKLNRPAQGFSLHRDMSLWARIFFRKRNVRP